MMDPNPSDRPTERDVPTELTDGGLEAAWRVGTGTREITPQRPMRLAGYGNRKEDSTGTAQSLYAKAVAFEDAVGELAVVVGTDLLGISRDLRGAVETACEESFGLPPSALLLNASHTHHGPEYRTDDWSVWEMDDADDRRSIEYADRLADEIVDAVGDALDERSPASLRYTHARCGFAMNRRNPTGDYWIVPYPDGAVDHDVPVLVAERDGAVRAILFGYACHPTSLPKQRTFHGDWPGVAMDSLESTYADATAVFVQGCGADQNPYPRREVAFTDQHGETMATTVQAAIEAQGTPIGASLAVEATETTIEYEPQPDRADLEARLDESADRYTSRLLAELDRDGGIRTAFSYPVQSLRFGSVLTLVALAGEVSVGYATAIKRGLEGNVWVAGCSNVGYLYVPTARQIHEGGYEPSWVNLYWEYPNPLKLTVEDRVTEAALGVAQRTGATRRPTSG